MASELKKQNNLSEFFQKLLEDSDFYFLKEFYKEFPNGSVYFVGGAVRDVLLGKEIEDFDLVIEGLRWNDVLSFFKKYGKITPVLARQFFTFKFKPNKSKRVLEIALPRREKHIGPFLKDFDFFSSPNITIEEDVLRRDFTINALAFDVKNKKLLDKVGGLSDIKNKIIRAVGNPYQRFFEDPSRILRGIRLAVQLGFDIEKETFLAMKELKEEIVKEYKDTKGRLKKRVSEEIIAKEFLIAFNCNPSKTIEIWDKVSLLSLILEEISKLKGVEQPPQFHSEGDVFSHTLLVLKNLDKESSLDLKLAALFHDIGKPQTKGFNPKKEVISFYGHNKIGEEIARKIINRLRLEIFPKSSPLHINKKKILWLIANHMILMNINPHQIKKATLKKYFLREDGWGEDLLKLIKADFKASLRPDLKPNLERYYLFEGKIKELSEEIKNQKLPARPFLSGDEIMTILNINQGPIVGQIKEKLLEKQLEGKIKNKKDALKEIWAIYKEINSN